MFRIQLVQNLRQVVLHLEVPKHPLAFPADVLAVDPEPVLLVADRVNVIIPSHDEGNFGIGHQVAVLLVVVGDGDDQGTLRRFADRLDAGRHDAAAAVVELAMIAYGRDAHRQNVEHSQG